MIITTHCFLISRQAEREETAMTLCTEHTVIERLYS
jgi:hypothetical protein